MNLVNQHALDVLEYDQIRKLLESHATSGLGKRQVRQIRPLTDRQRIEELIAETTELKKLLAPSRELPIGGLHDLFPLLDKLDRGEDVLLIEEILLIADTLRAGRAVRAYLEDADESAPRLRRLAEAVELFPGIEERIAGTFNEGGAIKNSASPGLKSIRRTIEQLRGRIRSKLQSLLRASNVSPYLQDTGIRQVKGRPTLAIKAQHASRVSGARRDRSDSGSTVFIEPEAIRGMGDELEAALDAEKAEMLRILQEITAMIASRSQSMRRTLEALAHIDMTYAKVRLSRAFEMNPPRLNTDGVIRLREARHPLLLDLHRRTGEPEEVVPIDIRLGDDFHSLIITGPNTGGKTVTLKTVGLLTLMAQSGMHVPAADPSVAIFQDVLADIGDEQSIEQSLSTFSSHLRHIGEILEQAREQTLVLMDELGGGTDPAEGAALARSIMEYLHARRVRTAASTHISALKELGYTVPGMENAAIEFDVATLKPTHRVVIGTPGSSNALVIARRLGLPDEVLGRAESIPQDGHTAELINQLQAAKTAAAENQRATEQAREEAERMEQEYRRKLEELDARETELQERGGEEAFAALRGVREQLDQLRQREPTRRSLLRALEEISEAMGGKLEESPQAKRRRTLKAGDKVLVRSLDRVGVLREIDAAARKGVVEFGSVPMRVSLEDVDAV